MRDKKKLYGLHLPPDSDIAKLIEKSDNQGEFIKSALEIACQDGIDPRDEKPLPTQAKELQVELLKQRIVLNKIKTANGIQKIHTEFLRQEHLKQRIGQTTIDMAERTLLDKFTSNIIEPIGLLNTLDKIGWIRIYENYICCGCRRADQQGYYKYDQQDPKQIHHALEKLSDHINTQFHIGQLSDQDKHILYQMLSRETTPTLADLR